MRAEAFVTEYFYNNAQRGFCETRIINQTLSLRFLGNTPMVFKPGMLFEGAVAVRYHDQVALPDEVLRDSQLEIKVLTFFFFLSISSLVPIFCTIFITPGGLTFFLVSVLVFRRFFFRIF